tara:strand:- start:25 stop:1074 length:1050 start_codon:yes stop_codon:yes gene_type:complete
MEDTDYLIVGQGLVGSILAYKLTQRGKRVIIIDKGSGNTSSRQASGLINPITGRRFVKTWMIEELIPAAKSFYKELSARFNSSFYQETSVLKILHSNEQVNDFHIRMASESYANYLFEHTAEIPSPIQLGFGQAKIEPVLQIDINLMLDDLFAYLKDQVTIHEAEFEYASLIVDEEGFRYNQISAKKVIFAEGYKMRFNPYFNYLPIQFAKGEALIIECRSLNLDCVLNSKININPLGNHQYCIGSTYDWNDMAQTPTPEKKKYLLDNFASNIDAPFKVVEHKVGIRPTVVDRRPLLGEHPKHKNMYVFNGMGTKGLSLTPYFADHFIELMENGTSLLSEVNIERFYEA